jgi:hypothetical protein
MSVLYLERTLEDILSRAPEVTVYFDPADPQRSVLSVGVKLHHLIKILGLGVFITIVILTLHAEP